MPILLPPPLPHPTGQAKPTPTILYREIKYKNPVKTETKYKMVFDVESLVTQRSFLRAASMQADVSRLEDVCLEACGVVKGVPQVGVWVS